MKVYRVHLIDKTMKSRGYKFSLSEITAGAWAKDILKGHTQLETLEIAINRQGIVDALRQYASHPNNG